jgi:hypothetical protein
VHALSCRILLFLLCVQLVEIDLLYAERQKRRVAGPVERRRACVPSPPAPGPRETALGRDEDPLSPPGPPGQRAGYQRLVVAQLVIVEAIDVRGVDEGDASVERRVNEPDGLGSGWAILEREVHPAESDGGNGGSPGPKRPLKQGRAVW